MRAYHLFAACFLFGLNMPTNHALAQPLFAHIESIEFIATNADQVYYGQLIEVRELNKPEGQFTHVAKIAVQQVGNVHRATHASTAAFGFSHHLSYHALEVATFCQVMRMGTVAREDLIILLQYRTHPCRNAFLSYGQVRRASHLLLRIFRGNMLFDKADAQHGTVKV